MILEHGKKKALTLLLVAAATAAGLAARAQEGAGPAPEPPKKQQEPAKAPDAPRPKLTLQDLEDAVLDVADKARAAVVSIDARHEGDVLAPRRVSLSGCVWDDEGLVVTLARDLDAASAITIAGPDGEPVKARLEGVDDETGVALIRVEDKRGLRPIERGSTDKLRPGSFVVAVGNPFGLRQSVSFGTLAGVGRTVRRGPWVTKDALQITVAVNPGDPGGLVVDARGRMIGVLASSLRRTEGGSIERDLLDMVRKGFERFLQPDKSDKPEKGEKPDEKKKPSPRSPGGGAPRLTPDDVLNPAQGISFALAIEDVQKAVERIRKDQAKPRPTLGIDAMSVDDTLRKTLGLDDAQGGILVIGVRDGSAAAKADIRAKDVLVAYNGHDVKDANELKTRLRETALGSQVKVDVLRDGKRITIEVTLEGRRP